MTTIEVFADIWCPFAHVGLRAVVQARAAMGRDDVALRVRAWPLELVNGAPMDPDKTAHHIADLRRDVAADLFVGFDRDHFPTTMLPALSLAAQANAVDDATGEAVSLALRDALFEEGRDVSDPGILGVIGAAHGVPGLTGGAELVTADWHAGQARGVQGSPHFFCGDLDSFCPSLDLDRDPAGDLHVKRRTEVLDAFLVACLAS